MIVACPKCEKKLQVSEQHAGKQVQCPDAACAAVFQVDIPNESIQSLPPSASSASTGAPAMPQHDLEPIPVVLPSRHDYGRGEDDFDEFDEYPRSIHKQKANTGLQTGLGIASLVVGGSGLIVAMIPCFGYAGVIAGGVGIVLGVIGIAVAFMQQRQGMSLPVAGTGLSVAACLLGILWIIVVAQFLRRVSEVGSQITQTKNQFQQAQNQFQQAQNQLQIELQKQRQQNQIRLQQQQQQKQIRQSGHPKVLEKLKKIGIALHDYHDNQKHFPASGGKIGNLSWRVEILPYLGTEEAELYKKFRHDEPWDSPHNKKLLSEMPDVFSSVHAGQINNGWTHFKVLTRPDGPFDHKDKGPRIVQIVDGASNTLMVVEATQPVQWTKPDDLIYDKGKPVPKLGRMVPTGFHAVLFSGKARFIRKTANEEDLRAWITADGGEPVPAP